MTETTTTVKGDTMTTTTTTACRAPFMSTGVHCRLFVGHAGPHRGWLDNDPETDTTWTTGPKPVTTEHVFLVPRFITGDKFKAMDIAADDYAYNSPRHPELEQALKSIRDRRVMALPDSERQSMGLSGAYWKVTIETYS